jgi:hypothetical protein
MRWVGLTWMENVAHGAVIEDHDFAQVGLNLSEIFDVGPVAKRAVLSIVSSSKVLALDFQPIDDRISVLLH